MKRLVSIGLILLILISGGLIFDYSASDTAKASIIDKIELTDQRTRTSKTYWLGETPEGNQRYALDASIGSVHYKENGQWLEIDSAIVESPKANWDWEVEKGHWKLLVKDDTSVAVGKDGHWIGFRYEGFAYLDKSTDEYVILENRRQVTPTVSGNKIRWDGIFYGVNLEYIYGNDRFKENLEITQAARNWLASNPPSSYGLNNQTSYLVGYIQCDWRYSYKAKDVDGNSINWTETNEFQETPINFWHPYKNKIVSALPVDYAFSESDPFIEPLALRKRFIKKGDNHYLLFGAKVTDLNQFPRGTIVFDPTIDEQVGASADDGFETESNGSMSIYGNSIQIYSGTSSRDWGAFRFLDIDIPQGNTIDVAYAEYYILSGWPDDANFNIHFEDGASPATLSGDAYDITGRARTATSVSWIEDSVGTGGFFGSGISLVTPLQEVIDDFTTTEVMIIARPNQDATKQFEPIAFDYDDNTYGAKLHIEYSAGGVSAPTVVTNVATSVEETTATLSGNITATGGENCTDRGFFWGTNTGHPYASNWTEQGNFGVSQFTHGLTSLTKGELYYYIATANNSAGTGNGTVQTFLTKPDEPTSLSVTDQTSSNISISWTNGTGRDTTLVRYRTDQYPTGPTNGTLSYNSTGTSHVITGLSAGQIHYIRLWSWCTEGGLEQYSDNYAQVTDYTLPADPSGMVTENVTATGIDARWTKGIGGDYTMVRRKTGSYPTSVSDGTQAYYNTGSSFSDSGLPKGTTQYYRAWSRDSESNYYSDGYTQSSNTTLKTAPTVTNASGATNISDTTARINGELTDDGGESCNVTMFWGTTDGSDNVSAWEHEVDKGSLAAGTFFENLTSLNVTTMYFYISRAINTEGTDWADTTANFTTLGEGEALLPPTNFTATYVNENEITLTWTPGTFAEYTMIRANYGAAPANIEEGYCVYYGAASNATDTLVELNLRDATVSYSAWSENTTMSWSDDYATASVENLGMSELVDAILPIVIVIIFLVIAHWRRITILYVLAGFACIIYGFVYWSGGIYISLLVILLGMVSFLEAWLDKGKVVK